MPPPPPLVKTLTKSKIIVLIYITIFLKKTMKLIEQIQQKLDQFLTMFWVVPFRKKCPYIELFLVCISPYLI